MYPFSLIYGAVIVVRNYFYDKNFLKSTTFNFPIICVGNLATGGTGKTPTIEYLINLLHNNYNVATLSRGYKRKTKGFAIANNRTTALEIGDEPMQFHLKFPNITVAVGEERIVAIPHILQAKPHTSVILLDDGFQHRAVQAGLNILLTDYNNLYNWDLLLPAGDLRDVKASAKRAQIIIVTKCKADLSKTEAEQIRVALKLDATQKIFFTEILYAQPYHLFTKAEANFTYKTNLLLIAGIANPKPLKQFLTTHAHSYDMLKYADHHIFDSGDLKEIKKSFDKITSTNKMIITTEKDAVRLSKFESQIATLPIYVLPIKQHFMFDEAAIFNSLIINFINSYLR